MIGLVSDGVIHLKADSETIPLFEAEGQGPFTYPTKKGVHTLTSYWRMPDRLYDDVEELARWARAAHAVAVRATVKPKKKSVRRAAGKSTPLRRPSRQKVKQPRRPPGRSRK